MAVAQLQAARSLLQTIAAELSGSSSPKDVRLNAANLALSLALVAECCPASAAAGPELCDTLAQLVQLVPPVSAWRAAQLTALHSAAPGLSIRLRIALQCAWVMYYSVQHLLTSCSLETHPLSSVFHRPRCRAPCCLAMCSPKPAAPRQWQRCCWPAGCWMPSLSLLGTTSRQPRSACR